MRSAPLLVIAMAAASGCLLEPEEGASPLLGLCPQWTQGPGVAEFTLDFAAGDAKVLTVQPTGADPNNRTGEGWYVKKRPLDLVRVQFSYEPADAGLTLRAARTDGNLLGILDYRDQRELVPSVHVANSPAADQPWDILLTAITQNEAPAPGPIELRWTATNALHLSGNATFHYRVCGA